MERPNRLLVIPAFVLALTCLIHTQTATAWSYNIDYFRVDGNLPAGLQDDFNDVTLGPLWSVDDGTAEESGGVAKLKSPGVISNKGVILIEESGIDTPDSSQLSIALGSGDATATSRWITPVAPGINQSYQMTLETSEPLHSVDFHVGIINTDTTTAAALTTLYGKTVPTGLSGYFLRKLTDEVTDSETIDIQTTSIDPSWFVNSILLNLHYDDTNKDVSASISFDDGVTIWEPFVEYVIDLPGINMDVLEFDDWNLDAQSFTAVPIPAALPLFGSALGIFGLIGWKRRTIEKTWTPTIIT